jgi:hypothetical protein
MNIFKRIYFAVKMVLFGVHGQKIAIDFQDDVVLFRYTIRSGKSFLSFDDAYLYDLIKKYIDTKGEKK